MNVHVGLNVTNLEKSIEFYSQVFDASPVKVKSDYAKFLLQDPGLNFTLNLKDEVSGNQVGHFGFQVEDAKEVLKHKSRLEKLGFFAREEMDVTCCYATQDKFWVTDPDGNEWEFFYTKVDVESMEPKDSACCAPNTQKIEITNSSSSSCC
ncbi:ArsI/CadI family heavy metal resistance metalloenzyme [Fictibacillus enclensis]|uniref:ArsI/CadI family heavy metal resistance metalloenzyme n=1 Tax=Fictibacillus enclensis TaxID=1017270 RepID=UPI0025A1D7FE|nr:ArsI/CadI family heavy metal resistance metalloenzyme [Fictibacillus enclensis]MDM5338456.1 ArsI/CadI family heavy metal resistance metalloenzyme [Fictibacillus enclensis]